jgi:hypothetical protein
LKATGFKPLHLEHQSWFQNVPFKCNLVRHTTRRTTAAAAASAASGATASVGAAQVESKFTHSFEKRELSQPGFELPTF